MAMLLWTSLSHSSSLSIRVDLFLQLRQELFMKPCFLNERYLRKEGQYSWPKLCNTKLLNFWTWSIKGRIWIYLISFQLDEDDAVKEYQGYKRNHSWKWGMGRLQQLIFTCISIFIWLISFIIGNCNVEEIWSRNSPFAIRFDHMM